MRFDSTRTMAVIAAAAVLLVSGAGAQAPVDTQRRGEGENPSPNRGPRCESIKLKTAGKYGFCLLKQYAKSAKGTGTPEFSKCDAKFGRKWAGAEAAGGDQCPSQGDEAALQSFIAQHAADVSTALSGGTVSNCQDTLLTCNTDMATCSGNLGTCDGNLSTCTTNLGQAQTDLATCNASVGACNADLSTCNTNAATCSFFLAACQVQPTARPLKTGEITCHDANGTAVACAGSGQDGELQAGVGSNYADHGDGTITDRATGLTWEKLSDDGSIHDKDNVYTWTNAFNKVTNLNTLVFAGNSDWRLPNQDELQSLVKRANTDPAVDAVFNTDCAANCSVTTCSCTQSLSYWSSTSLAASPNFAWLVEFFFGVGNLDVKSGNGYVRAVRGGQ